MIAAFPQRMMAENIHKFRLLPAASIQFAKTYHKNGRTGAFCYEGLPIG
jgi:hypothetical protein